MEYFEIVYRFRLPDDSLEEFSLRLDPTTLEPAADPQASLPEWTRLEFNQCTGCPLDTADTRHCPAAVNLIDVVDRFHRLVSYDTVRLSVETEERTITQDTSAEQAISSLVGLLVAVSGCPSTAFFKPMARFHLPLASERETTYRSASMYLLAQYFLHKKDVEADLDLDGLKRLYEAIHRVNEGIAKRIGAASKSDATLNAVALLDTYTILLPDAVEDCLSEIRFLFEPYLLSANADT